MKSHTKENYVEDYRINLNDAVTISFVFSIIISLPLLAILILHASSHIYVWMAGLNIIACWVGFAGAILLLKTNYKITWIAIFIGYGALLPAGIIPLLSLIRARRNERDGLKTTTK